MCIQNIRVAESLDLGELLESLVKPGRERDMLQPSNNIEVFLLLDVSKIAAPLEIAERVEGHGLASRR